MALFLIWSLTSITFQHLYGSSFTISSISNDDDRLSPIEDSDAYKEGVSYNHLILWSFLISLSKLISDRKFSIGKTILESISIKIRVLRNGNRHFYNADGIIISKKSILWRLLFWR